MIKANELRIGNFFIDKDQQIYKVAEIRLGAGDGFPDNYIIGMNEERACLTDVAMPLPITSEWLIKYGFKQDDFELQFTVKTDGFGFCLKQDLLTKEWRLFVIDFKRENELARGIGNIKIEFVHQLQNVVYSLTEQEIARCHK